MKRVLLAAAVLSGCGGAESADSDPEPATATARVERRDLVDRETVTGTLGLADRGVLAAAADGTLTALRKPGAVVGRGGWTQEIDGARTGWLLYGRRPAWRDFVPGMADGADIRQLERNLVALGYDPGTVDEEWTWETTDAVLDFQEDRDLTEDGALARGEIVFRPGPTRVGEAKLDPGAQVRAGTPVADVASDRREVTVELEADRAALARGRVTVTLPSGRTVGGRVTEVGAIASAGAEGETPTVPVTVSVDLGSGGLDQAPVDVGFARERARDAIAVPVTALLAQPGGEYVVEVPGRGHVKVEPGLFADGHVAVTGELRAGDTVVVPR